LHKKPYTELRNEPVDKEPNFSFKKKSPLPSWEGTGVGGGGWGWVIKRNTEEKSKNKKLLHYTSFSVSFDHKCKTHSHYSERSLPSWRKGGIPMRYAIISLILIMLLLGCGEDRYILKGHVKDAQTHEPLSGVNLVLNNKLSTTTDANGHYLFEDAPSGAVRLIATRSGYQVFTAEVQIDEKENYEAIALEKVDDQSPVIQNIRVELVDPTTVRIRWQTDEPAISSVEYGATNQYGESVISTGQETKHEALLTNLRPETVYHYRIQATDMIGNGPMSRSDDGNPTLDARFTTSPEKSNPDVMLISTPGEFTNHRQITFRWEGCDDVTSAMDLLYSYYLSGVDADYSPFNPGTQKTYTELKDGTYTFYVRVRDAQGNEDDSPASFAFVVDTTPPTDVSIRIKDGDAYTSSTSVELQLQATGASHVWLSDVPNFTIGDWEPFVTQRRWELREGDGSKTIWAKFRDAAGNLSEVVADTILLDSTPPEPVSIVFDEGEQSLSHILNFHWEVATDLSGIKGYRVQLARDPKFQTIVYEGTISENRIQVSKTHGVTQSADYYLRVKAINGAGFESAWSSPSDGIHVQLNEQFTRNVYVEPNPTSTPGVTLHLDVQDAMEVRITGDVAREEPWQPIQTTLPMELTQGDGVKQLQVILRDAKGEETAPINIEILLDATPPMPPMVSSPSHPVDEWSDKREVILQWHSEQPVSGIVGYSYSFDQKPDTIPSILSNQQTSIRFSDISDGVWYFHLRAQSGVGLWSEPARYKVFVDSTPPKLAITYPADGSRPQTAVVEYYGEASDATSGVDATSFAYRLGDIEWHPFTNDAELPDWRDSDEIPHTETGEQTLSLRIRDLAGNETITVSRFGIQGEIPPTSVFAVGGVVYRADSKTVAPDGIIVRVLNVNTGKRAEGLTGGNLGEGRYTVTFLDFTNNRAAQVGDKLEISVWEGDRQITAMSYMLTGDDVLAGHALIDITTDLR
jgi:hypothetical protein